MKNIRLENQRVLILNELIEIDLNNIDGSLDKGLQAISGFKGNGKDNLETDEIKIGRRKAPQDLFNDESIKQKYRKIAPKEPLDELKVDDEKWRIKLKKGKNEKKPGLRKKYKARKIIAEPAKDQDELAMEIETCRIFKPTTEEISRKKCQKLEFNLLHCPYCSFKFVKPSSIRKHLSTHYLQNLHSQKYGQCKSSPQSLFKCVDHLRKHEEIIKCPICSYNFPDQTSVVTEALNHIRNVHTDLYRICIICGYIVEKCDPISRQIVNISEHVNKHFRNEDCYECAVCNFKTTINLELKSHFYMVHNELKNNLFNCIGCNFVSISISNLLRHLKGHGGTNVICETCNFVCENEYWFNLHCRTHFKRKFKCRICWYKCTDHFLLKYHMLKYHKTNNKRQMPSIHFKVEVKLEEID